MNAFMLWAKDHRKKLIANGFDGATVSKMLADEWKTLSDQHKQGRRCVISSFFT